MSLMTNNFIKVSKSKPVLFIISLAAIVVSMAAVFFYEGKAYYAYVSTRDQEKETTSMFACGDGSFDAVSVFRTIQSDERLPGIVDGTVSDDYCCGIYLSDWIRPEYVSKGFFDREEAQRGDRVILLSRGAFYRASTGNMSDETVLIGETEYTVKGIVNTGLTDDFGVQELYYDQLISAPVCMPIEAYAASGRQGKYLRVVFSETPSREQRDILESHLKGSSYRLPSDREWSAIGAYLNQMIGNSILLFIALYGIVSTAMLRQNMLMPRFRVYMMYGATRGRVMRMMTADCLALITIGFLLAVALSAGYFCLMPQGFVLQPTISQYVATFAVMSVITILALVIRSGNRIKRSVLNGGGQ